jgi:hypothetical protein
VHLRRLPSRRADRPDAARGSGGRTIDLRCPLGDVPRTTRAARGVRSGRTPPRHRHGRRSADRPCGGTARPVPVAAGPHHGAPRLGEQGERRPRRSPSANHPDGLVLPACERGAACLSGSGKGPR